MKTRKQQVHIFLIGGAGDQEPYYFVGPLRHVSLAEQKLQRKIYHAFPNNPHIFIHTLGYNRIFQPHDVEENVLLKLQHDDLIYLIGHSLGGWNGAHLARFLADHGYRVRLLATLDPVGEGTLVWLSSNIFQHPQPEPQADFWINLRAETQEYDISDVVARIGEQWTLTTEPDINETSFVHHANAQRMLTHRLSTGKSIIDYLIEDIREAF